MFDSASVEGLRSRAKSLIKRRCRSSKRTPRSTTLLGSPTSSTPYLQTMAERAETAGSDPRPFIFERQSRRARIVLLLLMLAATALVCARIGPGGSFNAIMARATLMAVIFETLTFLGAFLAIVLPRGSELIAAWAPVALILGLTLRGLQRLERLR